MDEQSGHGDLDFEALRLGIERRDPDLLLGFYAEDAELSIVDARQSPAFRLRGKAEIAKHLRAAFGPETYHRVEEESVGEERVKYREACEYPDGGRVVVETTLELRGGEILRQTDVVTGDASAGVEAAMDGKSTAPKMNPGVGALPLDRLPRPGRATEKEDPS